MIPLRKYDPVVCDRNHPFAHGGDGDLVSALCGCASCWGFLGFGAYGTYRMWRLVAVTFDAVELQIDTVSSAAVSITVDVQRAAGTASQWTVYALAASLMIAALVFLAKKMRLRLSGMEPEANIPSLVLECCDQEMAGFRLPRSAAALRHVCDVNPLYADELHAIWSGPGGQPQRPVVIHTGEPGLPLRNWSSRVTYCNCSDHLQNGPGFCVGLGWGHGMACSVHVSVRWLLSADVGAPLKAVEPCITALHAAQTTTT